MDFIERIIDVSLNTKSYKFIQISDLHAINTYTFDPKAIELERKWKKNKKYFADFYDEAYFNKASSSYKLLMDITSYLNDNECDLVLFTGDIIDFISDDNLEMLKEELGYIKHPYLYIPGNHDNFDEDYKVIEFKDLIVFGVNNANKEFNTSQVEKLKELISKNKEIIVCMHIPIKNKYNQVIFRDIEDYYYIDYDSANLITKTFIDNLKASNINLIICGHLHGFKDFSLDNSTRMVSASSALNGNINIINIK